MHGDDGTHFADAACYKDPQCAKCKQCQHVVSATMYHRKCDHCPATVRCFPKPSPTGDLTPKFPEKQLLRSPCLACVMQKLAGGIPAGPAWIKLGLDVPPLCDIPSGCCFFMGPWTVTRSSLRMLRRVCAFCRPLWPVLLLVSFSHSRSPVVGVLVLRWMWQDVPFFASAAPHTRALG